MSKFSDNKLSCRGRTCAECHQCRDWHFTGDQDTWEWICLRSTWTKLDEDLWCIGRYKLFEKRIDATCDYYARGYFDFYLDPDHIDRARRLRASVDKSSLNKSLCNQNISCDDLLLDIDSFTPPPPDHDDPFYHLCLCEKQ